MPRLLAESGRMGDAFPTTLAIAALATAALATAALATAAAHCRHRRPFLASLPSPPPSPPPPSTHPYSPDPSPLPLPSPSHHCPPCRRLAILCLTTTIPTAGASPPPPSPPPLLPPPPSPPPPSPPPPSPPPPFPPPALRRLRRQARLVYSSSPRSTARTTCLHAHAHHAASGVPRYSRCTVYLGNAACPVRVGCCKDKVRCLSSRGNETEINSQSHTTPTSTRHTTHTL